MIPETIKPSLEALEPIPKKTLADQVVSILKRMILVENLQEGHKLPSERNLAITFGVSRRVVREALSILAEEGLIVKEHGRGIFLSAFERDRLQDERTAAVPFLHKSSYFYDMRAAIELGAACLAADSATETDLTELENIIDAMWSKVRQKEGLAAEEMRFHLALLRATHNRAFQKLDYLLAEGIRLKMYDRPNLFSHNEGPQSVAEHQAIVDALRERDGLRAMFEMYSHLNSVRGMSVGEGLKPDERVSRLKKPLTRDFGETRG